MASLPPGKYDVFIIPDHSAGSGFLYLPSLRTNTNSFIAGFASALLMVVLGQTFAPAFQAWWTNFQGMGNAGMALLVVAVGLGAWSLGRLTSDSSGRGPSGWGGGGFYSGGSSMPGAGTGGFTGAGPSPHGAHPGSPPPNAGPPPGAHSPPPPKPDNGSYQRPPEPPPKTQQAKPKPQPDTSKNTWEKARDEVRKKEEERKAKETEERRRAEATQRLKELREKEARERAQREAERARREQEAKEKAAKEQEARDREAREKEAKERKEKELREAREKELRERLARDREERRKRVEAERKRKEEEAERKRKEEEAEKKRKEEEEASQTRKSSTYAYSGVGERMSPWPNGKPPSVAPTPPPSAKKPPPPTATSVGGDDADAYSYRPYDQPKKPARRPSNSDLSESSWAPSQSTAHTSPPPSFRGGYSTKDPDKIVIKAVYSFVNQYAKTPASQLISGLGTVTDGLILRITTEGLFIDDDVRGVAQREWDVKAWTLKTVEVWCPVHFLIGAIAANSPPSPNGSKSPNPALSASNISTAFFAKTVGGSARLRAAERSAPKPVTGDDADDYLTDVLRSCKDSCRFGDCASKFAASNLPATPANHRNDDASSMASGSTRVANNTAQTGDWKAKGLHLLRATVRDQEGKRYLFIIGEEEGWKLAVGLQRLRRGTQARALGVSSMSGIETKTTLDLLGWG
ncbi:Protein split ends [Cytospora mali]|uniref:Protein split ends n=1 Tax=Cytospora mali TaxID=578113 RepID=A0A194V5W9_CYTMA|nr:Protein split ends [Valsa mali var. pyri (nom. inval.)]